MNLSSVLDWQIFVVATIHEARSRAACVQCSAGCRSLRVCGEVGMGGCGSWGWILNPAITREIRQASSPTMRGHFGCILKANGDYTTGVW